VTPYTTFALAVAADTVTDCDDTEGEYDSPPVLTGSAATV
jgi:hypothetical protein